MAYAVQISACRADSHWPSTFLPHWASPIAPRRKYVPAPRHRHGPCSSHSPFGSAKMAPLGSPQNYPQCPPHPPLSWRCRGRMLPATRMSRGRACIGSIWCPVDTTGDIRVKTLLVYADTLPGLRYPSSPSPYLKTSTRLVYVQRDAGIRVVSGSSLLAKTNHARAPNKE